MSCWIWVILSNSSFLSANVFCDWSWVKSARRPCTSCLSIFASRLREFFCFWSSKSFLSALRTSSSFRVFLVISSSVLSYANPLYMSSWLMFLNCLICLSLVMSSLSNCAANLYNLSCKVTTSLLFLTIWFSNSALIDLMLSSFFFKLAWLSIFYI